MGTKKTKLMRGDRYGLLKAAELAAEMIGQYERARDGAREIRVESLDEAVWDDIHVVRNHQVDKWQVKRLMQEFDHKDAEKLVVGVSDSSAGGPTNLYLGVLRFVPVTEGNKELFGLQDLAVLCQEARKPGLVPADFVRREQSGAAYKFVSACLPDSTSDSVLATLRRLRVEEIGMEERLHKEAAVHLKDFFVNAEELVNQLHNWFLQHPDGTILVNVQLLYEQVIDPYGKRDPTRPRWIHLMRDTVRPQWTARGPLGFGEIVERSWGTDEGVRVQLGTPPFSGELTSSCLSRLMLHMSSRAVIEADPAHQWQAHSLGLCAGTLGIVVEAPAIICGPIESTPPHPPREEVTERELSSMLSSQMDDRVWKEYAEAVSRHLNEDEIGADLRTGMQDIWTAWNAELDKSISHRASFVRAMLATAEEWRRKGFEAAVRTGRLLVEDLARATIVALAIAAALAEGGISTSVGSEGSVENLRFGSISAHLIALATASHPNDRKPCRLSDAPGAMFSGEAGIAILGVVDASASELYGLACEEAVPFHASDEAAQNYYNAGRPFPLLTASPLFRGSLRRGTSAMRQYLAEVLGQMNADLVKGLREAVEGASTNV